LCIKLPNEIKLSKSIKYQTKYKKSKIPPKRNIREIIPFGEEECICIKTSNPSGLFLIDNCVVTHNTTLGSIFIMTKLLLIPFYNVYILAGVGSQSQEMFLKIENITKRNIASFTGLTDVFFNETVKSTSNKDGFTHNPLSFKCTLFNGSSVNSLNGAIDSIRGKRSSLNFYDESGYSPDDLFVSSEPFTTQDSNFALGGNMDVTLIPQQFPNQLIYASSASSTDTYFFRKYSDFSKKMFLGDKNYFVADINSDVVMNATFNGKKYPVAILTQEKIDIAMRENKEKALREYKNIFTNEGGVNQAIKRATIIRNSYLRKPVMCQEGGQKFILAQDPGRSLHDSICTVAQLIDDPKIGYRLEICNCVSWVDIAKKKKTPMKATDQVKGLKQLILNYNGNAPDYENIEKILIDDGAGGGGVTAWADPMLDEWFDSNNDKHKGFIDLEHHEYCDCGKKYPNNSTKLKLITPQKYKKELFDALVEMLELDLITFTEEYTMKGYLVFNKDIEKDIDDEIDKNKKIIEREQFVYKLSFEEELALKNIDLAKEEIVHIHKFVTANENYSYDLSPDKKFKMNDDRAYTMAMLAWWLKKLRRSHIARRKKQKQNFSKMFKFKQPIIRKFV
jgi:hypothetical protein